jgi:hypothetical protein
MLSDSELLGLDSSGCLLSCVAVKGDGWCDFECYTAACDYDLGDCNTEEYYSKATNTYACSPGCPIEWLGDKRCDAACNTMECNWDHHDCCNGDKLDKSAHEFTTSFDVLEHFSTIKEVEASGLYLPRMQNKNGFRVQREVGRNNVLVSGILIMQKRVGLKSECEVRSALIDSCLKSGSDKESTETYGIDPVFSTASSIYNKYIVSENFYSASQLNAAGVPYGFRHTDNLVDSTYGPSPFVTLSGFPVFFDTNLGANRAQSMLSMMQDGKYIDGQSDEIKIMILCVNGNAKLFALTEITLTFEKTGAIRINTDVNTFSAENSLDWTGQQRIVEIVFMMFIVFQIFGELFELLDCYLKSGSVYGYFRSFWNYIDICNLIMLVFTQIQTWRFYFEELDHFAPMPRYPVYNSLANEGYYLNYTHEIQTNHPYQLVSLCRMFEDAQNIGATESAILTWSNISVLLMTLRMMKTLHFQPRMGLITRTLQAAAMDLGHFFILLLAVFLGFVCMGHLGFGDTVYEFSTMTKCVSACFLMLMGEFEILGELEDTGRTTAAVLFFYSFVLICFLLLLNILLAIIVDSYAKAKEEAEGSTAGTSSMPAELMHVIKMVFNSPPFTTAGGKVSDGAMIQKLNTLLQKVDPGGAKKQRSRSISGQC